MVSILMFREIQPLDAKTCDHRCPWRDGHSCDLFCTTLVPLGAGQSETRCRRSRDCKRAERQSRQIQQRLERERNLRLGPQVVTSNQGEG